ncbi:hypothetical protein RJ641_014796 [Dillenia turbinata]|uniref:Transcription initiation factor TFIID subunit 2 n=1 Tax=Dillenia turbinata TaxID=194707 RepID=A0AAN8V462_9MAGN
MAKPRKLKPEDQKSEPSSAILRHQKLCLYIDFDSRRIFGFTELEIAVPDTGIVALHASNLAIERVTVDGEPVEFDHFSHFPEVESEKRWSSIDNVSSAADAASATYVSALERESNPNLIIKCEKSLKLVNEQAEKPNSENGGIHYDLEFTVADNLVAVSTGSLLHQILSNDDPPRKTYVYRIKVPVSARWISLVVAPFEILPDQHSGVISHMCLPGYMQKLLNTVNFFHSAFSHYEVYLSASFPFESYKQVFIPPEMAVTSLSSGASISIFGSQILFDERIIDQVC